MFADSSAFISYDHNFDELELLAKNSQDAATSRVVQQFSFLLNENKIHNVILHKNQFSY